MATEPSEKSVSSASADGNQIVNNTPAIAKTTSNSSDPSQSSAPINYFQDDEEAQTNDISRMKTNESLQEQDNIARILTRRSTNRGPIPTMGGDRDYPPELGDQKIYQVDFDGPDDPNHPHNWPLSEKLTICAGLAVTTLTVAWGSSIFSSAIVYITKIYHVANVVGTLGISLYVLGFASGPVIWSPLSELYGRKMPILLSSFLLLVLRLLLLHPRICRHFCSVASLPVSLDLRLSPSLLPPFLTCLAMKLVVKRFSSFPVQFSLAL